MSSFAVGNEDIDQILRDAFEAEASGDLTTAINLFKRAARCGSNDARSKLGTIYDDVLTPPSPSKAAYWYKSAVKGGDANCAWNLAMHYAGMGRRRGYLYWLRIAAEMGADAPLEIADNAWWKKRNSAQFRNSGDA
jgi:TPR repeat protein